MKAFLEQTEHFFAEQGLWGLALLAFIESSFFPLPPDLLLIAMSLNIPQKALLFALVCTIFSVLGGILGYFIGQYGGRPVFYKLFRQKEDFLHKVEEMYNKYGNWAVLAAAFTPIPYKVFTIASGIFAFSLPPFILMSILGRGTRFFLIGLGLMFFGESIKASLELIIIVISICMFAGFGVLFFFKRKSNPSAESPVE